MAFTFPMDTYSRAGAVRVTPDGNNFYTPAVIFGPDGVTPISSTNPLPVQQTVNGSVVSASNPLPVTLESDVDSIAKDGTDATGVTPPSGAVGIRGWLSGLYGLLKNGTATFTQYIGGSAISNSNPMPSQIMGRLVQLDSTTTALAANGTYTTPSAFSLSGYDKIVGSVFADQAGTLLIEQSWDGTHWDVVSTVNVSANSGQGFSIDVVAPNGRLVYTNGSTAQTTFRLYAGGKTL
jgi:hypothetical protein